MRLLLMLDRATGWAIFEWMSKQWLADIKLVVTISENQISDAARRLEIPTITFSSDSQVITDIQKLGINFDIGLLLWWPRIIGTNLLSLPKLGFINTHPSLLPYNRGKHYNFWALVEESPFGVTLHRVDSGIDSGDIIAQRAIPYDWEDTGATLYEKASTAMIELVKDTYPKIRSLNFTAIPQPADIGSFHKASELNAASQIYLDRRYSGREILNLLRARTFRPHPACWFMDGEETYEVRIEIRKRPK